MEIKVSEIYFISREIARALANIAWVSGGKYLWEIYSTILFLLFDVILAEEILVILGFAIFSATDKIR